MKLRNLFYSVCCLLLLGIVALPAHAQKRRTMQPFEHLAVSLTAGTTGAGVEVGVPLLSRLAIRGGYSSLPVSYSYTYDDIGDNGDPFSVPLKAKSEIHNGNVMVDFFPVKDSRFHLTGGLFFGSDRLLTVTGRTDYNEPIEIGDIWISPNEFGDVSAWAKVKSVKPYLGLGFGRTIPRTRFGFRFELGGLFQGAPEIETDNDTVNNELDQSEGMNDLNEFLDKYAKVYPVMKFNFTFRIF